MYAAQFPLLVRCLQAMGEDALLCLCYSNSRTAGSAVDTATCEE
jgi:hypothetical protein